MPRTHVRHRFALPASTSERTALPLFHGLGADTVSATTWILAGRSAVGAPARWEADDIGRPAMSPDEELRVGSELDRYSHGGCRSAPSDRNPAAAT